MKLKIQPLCVFYFLSIAVLGSVWTCVGAILALLVHESAHLLVGYWMGERAESIEFTPFGGIIRYPSGMSAKKGVRGLAISGAGPFANYVMLWVLSLPTVKSVLPQYFLQQVLLMQAGMLFLNLLPVFPLDGGQMAFCIGYYVFPITALVKVLSWGGMLVGITLMGIGFYGVVAWGKLNISLLLVGGYLAVHAYLKRSALWAENLYVLLNERPLGKKMPVAVKLYTATPKTRLLSLVDAIADSHSSLFWIDERWVDEKNIIRALMWNPNANIAEMLEKEDIFHENDGKCLQHSSL